MVRFAKALLVFAPMLSLFGWWDDDVHLPRPSSVQETLESIEIDLDFGGWWPFSDSWPFFNPRPPGGPSPAPPDPPATAPDDPSPPVAEEPTEPTTPGVPPLSDWPEWLASGGDPADLVGFNGFYGDQRTGVHRWISQNPRDPLAVLLTREIASQPVAYWVADGAGAELSVFVETAAAENMVPVVVAYNIPHRDCGQHSSGGAADAEAYRDWVDEELVPAFGDHAAMLILEPDSLIHLSCLSGGLQDERLSLLSYAVEMLAERAPNTAVYLDGGDGVHNSPAEMAPRLAAAGIENARGFAVNVSNYNTDEQTDAFAAEMRRLLTEDHDVDAGYVVDTSRNGAGPGGDWCNPPDRRLGEPPRLATEGEAADAQLWIKHPGTSDGDCGIGRGTVSGEFYPDIARELLSLN
ncbi:MULTISPECIES: glycoside hydrolase family 6 protein [Actinoalloteichus]|uniref:Glucanase n=1 Tax=Actinoalloteichus fjordicus TaxID=1612552 RepID=A0AAC9PVA5_9PSEU|nr:MULTISPECIES: glycoside hydrolase family 6 protein [Actinoalloteichus]APU17751.1 Glycosyl hydrolases family 6 [Actinoalloteichus fjordicus]APU23829.1 Glycosyl hydrolases family 6 [Actinoalloteichus sp. GBA129-24]